jgi:hypothetical protein
MRKRTMKKRSKGGGWFGEDASGPGPFGKLKSMFSSTPPAPPALAPTPLPGSTAADSVVAPVTTMAATAGKRMKKYLGGDPTCPKDAEKVLGTAPEGDKPAMLGGRRRRRTVKKTRKSRK